jgi:hypothetical protein
MTQWKLKVYEIGIFFCKAKIKSTLAFPKAGAPALVTDAKYLGRSIYFQKLPEPFKCVFIL